MQLVKRHAGFAVFGAVVLLCAIWLWVLGGQGDVSRWAAAQQRDVQNAMAGALRAVRGGSPWAVFSLLSLCFAYGFFHAAGPGHGKLVMGGYALGEDVPRRRLIGLTLAGSLGQAFTAILLVSAGALIFGWGRAEMTGLADYDLAQVSAVGIAFVGLWLVWRGLRRWQAEKKAVQHTHSHAHDHDHIHDHNCDCGHFHGPTEDQLKAATSWRSALGIVGVIAIRPCTGALFILILTYGMGIAWVGIMGAIVMGLGTALLTIVVALGAGQLRGGLAQRMQGASGVRVMSLIEIAAGVMVALLAVQTALSLG